MGLAALSLNAPALRPTGAREPLVIELINDPAFEGDIARGTACELTAANYLGAIDRASDQSIVLVVDSAGGLGDEALLLHRALLGHPWRVVAHIIGRASSAAPLIALAADERVMAQDASIMVHEPRIILNRDSYAELMAMPFDKQEAIRNDLRIMERRIVEIIVERTGCALSTAREWMAAERRWSAAAAIRDGIAHRIDPAIIGSRADRIAYVRGTHN